MSEYGSPTPEESIAAEIRAHDSSRRYFAERAENGAFMAGIFGGLTVYAALKGWPASLQALEVAATLWKGSSIPVNLVRVRNESQAGNELRQILAQHELATGQTVPVYDQEQEEREPAIYDWAARKDMGWLNDGPDCP